VDDESGFHEQRIAEKKEKWKFESETRTTRRVANEERPASEGEPYGESGLNEEIEGEEEEADQKKQGAAIETAAGEEGDGADEGSGDGFETRFFADGVEGTDGGVTGKVATEKRKLILEPNEEISTSAPHKCGASHDYKVASNS
jgi:hypothetical protein